MSEAWSDTIKKTPNLASHQLYQTRSGVVAAVMRIAHLIHHLDIAVCGPDVGEANNREIETIDSWFKFLKVDCDSMRPGHQSLGKNPISHATRVVI